jgi:3-oxoacyl-[acyl-carrier-protein] synthase II
MLEPIAVTGVGAITSLGQTAPATWAQLIEGRSGIRAITRFPVAGLATTIAGCVDLAAPDLRVWSRTYAMAEHALGEALGQAGIDSRQPIAASLFVGMTGYEFDWSDRWAQARAAAAEPGGHFMSQYRHPANGSPFNRDGSMLVELQRRFSVEGPAAAVTTACASGASAIELAVKAIRRGETGLALAGASDGSVYPENVVRFGLLSALSRNNQRPEAASRPFSRTRDGFVMAEGAAFLVLESLAHARARGADILAYVRGVGSSSDGFHRTRSRPDGSGGAACLEQALRDARLAPERVDYINAHGTSTPENDRMETRVIKRVFGGAAYDLKISSNKSMLGHTLAAAGAVEAVMTVLTLRSGLIPPTINHHEPDDELDLDYVPNRAVERPVSIAMSNSFGFGGQNVSLLLGASRG